jgi:hypothetical protein
MPIFKKKKPPQPKIPTSPFSSLTNTSVASPFATGSSSLTTAGGKTSLDSSSILAPQLQTAATTAMGGFNSGLDYINQNPQQRFDSITSGNDLYYNVLADQLSKAQDTALARAQITGRSRGLENSNTTGAAMGSIYNDALRREREAQLASYNFGTQQATNQTATNLGAIKGLNELSSPLASLAGSQLMQGRMAGDQYARDKAMAEYQAQLQAYQLQQQNSGWGSGLGSILGAGIGLATGGAGSALIPLLGGIGGGIGGLATGGNGANSFSSAIGPLSQLGFGGFNGFGGASQGFVPMGPPSYFANTGGLAGGGGLRDLSSGAFF